MASEEEEIINLIAQELSAGKSKDMVAEELVQAGLPREEAITVVNAVAQQIQARRGGGGGKPAPGGQRGPPQAYQHHRSMMPYYVMLIAILVLIYLAFF